MENDNSNLLFSIIIPTYNRAPFLPKAINSISDQTYPNWELIIVDDGSTDNTKEVVDQFLTDSRVHYHYQENAERSAARNSGIRLSKGEYITFMDSDEYMDTNRLELLFQGIKNNNNIPALYFTDIRFEFSNPEENYVRQGRFFSFPVNPNELIEMIIGNPQFCASKEVFEKHKFNPNLTVGEDMEILFRISSEFPLIYLENNESITEIEHENRSVSFGNNSNLKQIDTFKLMFANGHPANNVSNELKNQKWSEVYLRACYYHIFNQNRISAAIYCLKSICLHFNDKPKFKLNLILRLLSFQDFEKIKLLFS
jgi:glycosyltransferase involved in cell wall biosynthesis